jgi:protein TonB
VVEARARRLAERARSEARERELAELRAEVERLRSELAAAPAAPDRSDLERRIEELRGALARRAAAPAPVPEPARPAAAQPPREKPPGGAAVEPVPPSDGAAAEAVVADPVLIRHRPPVYPPLARIRGVEGSVDFRVRVGADGRVMVLEPLGARAGWGFDEAARAAALSAVYRPATRDGAPVEADTRLRIEFRLAGER